MQFYGALNALNPEAEGISFDEFFAWNFKLDCVVQEIMQANEGFAKPNVQEHTAYAATRYLAWFQALSEERQQAYDAWIGGMADPANGVAEFIEFGETFAEADAD